MMRLLFSVVLFVVSTTQASEPEMLQAMSKAYKAGDLGAFTSLIHAQAPHDDSTFEEEIVAYDKLFRETKSRLLYFYDVTVNEDGSGTAWIYVKASDECNGLVEWTSNGTVFTKFKYECYEPSDLAVDGGLAGQAVDSTTTAIGLAQGAVEANPVVVSAPGIILPLKLGMSWYAESLTPESCRAWKDNLAGWGMGAGIWNVGVLLGASWYVAPLAIWAGIEWYEETERYNALVCRQYDPIHYAFIDADELIASK